MVHIIASRELILLLFFHFLRMATLALESGAESSLVLAIFRIDEIIKHIHVKRFEVARIQANGVCLDML